MAAWPRSGSARVFLAQRGFVAIGLVVLMAYAVPQIVRAPHDPFQWDLMFISGTLTLLGGLLATEGFDGHVDRTIRRLVDRDVVSLGRRELKAVLKDVQDDAEKSGLVAGVAIGIVALVAVLAANRHHPALYPLSLVGGFFVGYHLGRFGSFGRIGRHMRRRDLDVRPKPHHPDGVAGFRPVGELYFRQATLAAIPAAFLAGWSVLLPAWPTSGYSDYASWRWPYLGLLAIALGGVVFSFVAPMWMFHRIMRAKKEELIEQADRESARLDRVKAELAKATDETRRKALADEVQAFADDYAAIEDMPTWPVDPGTRRRFLNRNLLLALLPVAGNVAGLSSTWRDLLAAALGS